MRASQSSAAASHLTVSWTYPTARDGIAGAWDRLVGPGATRGENLLQSLAPLVACVAAAVLPLTAALDWPWWKAALAGLLAADMVGGVVTNSKNTAKRWYHRSGQTARHHLGFVALYLVQIALVGLLFRESDWMFVAGCYGAVLAGSAAIVFSPIDLQRPVALSLYVSTLAASLYWVTPTLGMEWFLPTFFLKLFVAHLPMEAPLAPTPGGQPHG